MTALYRRHCDASRSRRKPSRCSTCFSNFTAKPGTAGMAGGFHDDYGGRCLISAMAHLRVVMNLRDDPTSAYLRRALPSRYKRIDDFNDDCRSYDEIRAVIPHYSWLVHYQKQRGDQSKRLVWRWPASSHKMLRRLGGGYPPSCPIGEI